MAEITGRYRARARNKRSGIIYLVLSVLIVVVMIKWGLPFLLNLMVISGAKTTSAKVAEDTIPPQTPVIAALPEATNSGVLKIEGYTESLAKTEYWVNDQLSDVNSADTEGLFTDEVKLNDGENSIRVKAIDDAGNESWSTTKKVTLDVKPLELTVSSPTDGTEYFGANSKTVEIKGVVGKSEAVVTINGSYAQVSSKGEFSHMFMLNEGDNGITVSAVDKAGNQAEKSLSIKFIP